MSEIKNGYKNCKSMWNLVLNTEPSKDDKQDTMSYYTQTERNHRTFLDYTFLSHRALIHSKQTKDPKKIRDYNYDLEKTLEINLEMLKNLQFNYSPEENNAIKKLIEKIKQKNDKRVKNKQLIKAKKNMLVNLHQGYEEHSTKIERTNDIYENKIMDEQYLITKKAEYIIALKKRFKAIEKHLKYLALNGKFKRKPQQFVPNTFKINEYIALNTKYKLDHEQLSKQLEKIEGQISEIKKENILYKEETVLYRNKTSNMQLIRVVEFYRRIIRALQTKIKILRNSFENMTQTLHYLNLSDSKYTIYIYYLFYLHSCKFQYEKEGFKYYAL